MEGYVCGSVAPILFKVLEVLLRWDATEAHGTVNLAETKVLHEQESLLAEALT